MTNPAYGNPSLQENVAGIDTVIANSRVRATVQGASSTNVALYNPQGINWMDGTGATVSKTVGATYTMPVAELGCGLLIYTPSAGNTMTLDTAANIWTYFNNNSSGGQANLPYTLNGTVSTTTTVGDTMSCLIINGSASNTITLAAGTNGSFDGNVGSANKVIAVSSSKYIFIQLALISGVQSYIIYS